MREKIAGIIGGMGPEATVDLMARVIRATPALDDADHIRMIVDNNPKIPSRIKALIEGTGESPVPCLIDMARRLEAWGADFLAIPCNTAHYYYADVCAAVKIPVLNMIELTVARIAAENPGIERVGILAATAVLKTGLYAAAFGRLNVKTLDPPADLQNRLMAAIRTIKTGRYGSEETQVLSVAAASLKDAEAQALVVACTELSVIGDTLVVSVPLYDAAQVLAEAIVDQARAGSAAAPHSDQR